MKKDVRFTDEIIDQILSSDRFEDLPKPVVKKLDDDVDYSSTFYITLGIVGVIGLVYGIKNRSLLKRLL